VGIFTRKPKQADPQGVTLEIRSGFTAFSGTAYGNAQFRAAVDAIARHAAKLKAHSPNPRLEHLLAVEPNAYMCAYDLLYKTATAYYSTNNAFVLINRGAGGPDAFYPLTPQSVEFISGPGGLYVKMLFQDGRQATFDYGDIIHLRRHFSGNNDLLGSDNAPLFPLLETADTLQQGIGAATKNGVNIRGVLKFTSLVNPEQVKKEKELFVRDYFSLSNSGGVAATDQRFDFVPTNAQPYSVPVETVEAVNRQILDYLGISADIVRGSYSEDAFSAFYESTVEPFALLLSLECTRKCGVDIAFTAERLEFSSAKTRISLLHELLPCGIVTINEARRLLALPEVEGGERRLQSLNYVDATHANQYQEVEGKQDEPQSI